MEQSKPKQQRQQRGKVASESVLPMLPDTPNTRRLARAMLVATIRYNLLARPSKDNARSA